MTLQGKLNLNLSFAMQKYIILLQLTQKYYRLYVKQTMVLELSDINYMNGTLSSIMWYVEW